MISAWVVLLISFGAVAAAGGAVGLGIGIHRKATAKSKALKSEADLRVYMHKSKRNPNKERRLLKKFYKSKIRLANRILPL